MNRKNRIFFIVIFLISASLFSQNSIKESSIDSLLKIASDYYKVKIDSALFYSELAVKKAREQKDQNLLVRALNDQTAYLIVKKEFELADEIVNEIFSSAELSSTEELGDTYYNKGSIHYLNQSFSESIESYLMAINEYKIQENKRGLAKANLQIGVIYEKLGDMDIANYYYDESLAIGRSKKSEHNSENMPYDISYEKKIELSEKMLSKLDQADNPMLKAIIFYNLSASHFNLKNYKKSINYAEQSLHIKKNIGFEGNRDVSLALIGKSYLHMGNYSEANKYFSKALNITKKRYLTESILQDLVKIHEEQDDFENAFYYKSKLSKFKDSIRDFEESIKIAEISAKHGTEIKTKQISELKEEAKRKEILISQNRQKTITWILISVLFLLVSLLLIRAYISSQKKVQQIEKEKENIAKKVSEEVIILNNKSRVYLNKLKYIKSDGNYLEFITEDKIILDRNRLKNIISILPPNFVRVHKSYVINKNYIDHQNSTTVFLFPDIEIPLSRTYKSNLAS